jgi:TPR repeat protein
MIGKTVAVAFILGLTLPATGKATDLAARCLERGPKGDVYACRQAIRQHPTQVPLITAYGESLFFNAEYDNALRVFLQVTEMTPNDAGGYYRLGAAYGSLRNWPKAVRPLEKAIALAPDFLAAHEILAITYLMLKQPLAAFAENQNAAALGSITAMATIAQEYENGQVVPKDNVKALHWLHRAAQQGHAGAIRRLTMIYETGELAVTPDRNKAAYWRDRYREMFGARP